MGNECAASVDCLLRAFVNAYRYLSLLVMIFATTSHAITFHLHAVETRHHRSAHSSHEFCPSALLTVDIAQCSMVVKSHFTPNNDFLSSVNRTAKSRAEKWALRCCSSWMQSLAQCFPVSNYGTRNTSLADEQYALVDATLFYSYSSWLSTIVHLKQRRLHSITRRNNTLPNSFSLFSHSTFSSPAETFVLLVSYVTRPTQQPQTEKKEEKTEN